MRTITARISFISQNVFKCQLDTVGFTKMTRLPALNSMWKIRHVHKYRDKNLKHTMKSERYKQKCHGNTVRFLSAVNWASTPGQGIGMKFGREVLYFKRQNVGVPTCLPLHLTSAFLEEWAIHLP
jgi:hypothetical protein